MEKFDGILNFRDVGKTFNGFLGTKLLKEGCLFRSARLDSASEDDRRKLIADLKISHVIDLRSKSEHIKEAQKRNVAIPSAAPIAPSNVDAALPLKIAGLHYHEINLNGSAFERSLMRQLSWFNLSKLLGLMMLGYRIEAIGIMGREVLQPQGLIGLGCSSIDYCGDEILEVFKVLSDPSNYGLLIHCTQGKDRTGLIIALVLFLLGTPLSAIAHDYVLSEGELLPERDERLKEMREIGLTEDFAGTPPDWPEQIQAHIQEKYGNISTYLAGIGVDESTQAAVKANLAA